MASRSLIALALVGLFCAAATAMPGTLDPTLDTDGDGLLDLDTTKGPWDSIYELITKKNDTSMLAYALEVAAPVLGEDVMALLADNTTVATLFVPTDDAVNALGADALDALLADPTKVADILKYHIVLGQALTLADIRGMNGQTEETALEGQAIGFTTTGKKAIIDTTTGQKVPIYQYNMQAGAAIVHSIKGILIPGDQPVFPMAPTMAP